MAKNVKYTLHSSTKNAFFRVHLLATFIFKSGQLATFSGHFLKNAIKCATKTQNFQNKSGQWPEIFSKVASKKG
jgi:hypothetical protein